MLTILYLQTHSSVCVRKYKSWSTWHSAWAAQHVTEAQQTKHNDWMLGRLEGLRPNKTPYRTFTKFKVGEVSS